MSARASPLSMAHTHTSAHKAKYHLRGRKVMKTETIEMHTQKTNEVCVCVSVRQCVAIWKKEIEREKSTKQKKNTFRETDNKSKTIQVLNISGVNSTRKKNPF